MKTIKWSTSTLSLTLTVDNDGIVYLQSLALLESPNTSSCSPFFTSAALPLNSVRLAGEGNIINKTTRSLIGSYTSSRLRYLSHKSYHDRDSGISSLDIFTIDPDTNIQVINHLTAYKNIPVIQASATINNISSAPIVATQLSSFTIGGLTTGTNEWFHDYTLMTATNGWFREAQWREQSLPDVGIDTYGVIEINEGHACSQGIFSLANKGSFSTGSHLPMGILKRKDELDTWFWQIEHNGSWRWEIGDFKDSVYFSLGGPTSADHGWMERLEPGESFRTVNVALGRVSAGWEAAVQALTSYRRIMRRPHPDLEAMPIIFNDYMNCLMGDPNEDKIKLLLDPVAATGAEYFVIDAGWYADDSNWWDDVGLWEPSKKRFPSGFRPLLDLIRGKKLIPGLWIEPEVVGVRSVVGKGMLPEAAFFHESGYRVVEKGRYQLDYRHPEVIEWMDSVIERLVVEYGAGYLKFDYNIDINQGTDINTRSSGAAQLEHQRAYLNWVHRLLDRYPGLVIENCSSGAQRMEYAMLSVHPLQSTSDQQDPVLYAAIAAAMPTAVTPEQSATWAYPQPEWPDETNVITIINSLLGRVQLSGRLDLLSEQQSGLIFQGMQVYNSIKHEIKHAWPFWPLGLPRWHDEWVSLGLVSKCGREAFISVWRRGGSTTEMNLPFPTLFANCANLEATLLYPARFEASCAWEMETHTLKVTLPNVVCARLFHVKR